MTWPTRREVKELSMRAVRMTLDEGKLYGFSTTPEQQVEKALVDNFDFLYYLVWFAKMDEREECAKVADAHERERCEAWNKVLTIGGEVPSASLSAVAAAIRARGNT